MRGPAPSTPTAGGTAVHRALRLPMLAALLGSLGADEPRPPDVPTYIVVGTPADLDALLSRLGRPDFLLKSGPDPAPPADRGPAAPVVESVEVTGEVRDELATIEVAIVAQLDGPGRQWVPIRLDGASPSMIVEAGQDRPIRASRDGGWAVELEGAGRHELRARLVAPIRPTADGGRLDLAIPEAPSTGVDLAILGPPIEAASAGIDGLTVEPPDGDRPPRLRGHLAPRKRLDLAWRCRSSEASQPTALLVQGTLAGEVDRGSFRVVSTWRISSDRGIARSLTLRLSPADEVIGLELDLAPVTPTSRRDGPLVELTIPLREPLRPNKPRRLDLTTRRALAAPPLSIAYRGVEFPGAIAQSGVLAIVRGEDLWLGGAAGRGIRQVDPRDNLPPTLAARPSTALAYRFVEQPFDLALRVDPSTPIVRVEPRSTLVVGDELARVDVCLDYQVSQGRIFEVVVDLPPGLALTDVGPESTVAGSAIRVDGAARRLVVQLTPRARDDRAFRLRLMGRQPLISGPSIDVGLPRAEGIGAGGGLISVLTRRGLGLDLGDGPAAARFAPASGSAPADWPAEPASASMPAALWLRAEGSPESLPLRRNARPPTLWHQSSLDATLGNARAEVRQETTLRVADGSITEVDLTIPAAAVGRWEALGPAVSAGPKLGELPGGAIRQRLRLARPTSGTTTLRFRVDIPLPVPPLGETAELALPVIGLAGTAGPASATLRADPRLGLTTIESATWVALAGPGVALRSTGRDEPSALTVRVARPADLAPAAVVVSRLDLRTRLAADGEARVSASLSIDGPAESVTIALPPGAEGFRATADGLDAGATAVARRPDSQRLSLPRRVGDNPRRVSLDYRLPATAGDRRWQPPTVVDGLVLASRWELRVPWHQVVVGTPRGWEDGNEWHWDRYMWKRRPAIGALNPARAEGMDHGYAFDRPGAATALRPLLMTKGGLVGACSGVLMALGLPLVLARWRGRGPVVAFLGVVGATLVAWEPGASVAVAQSSALGVVLTGVAAGALQLVERRSRFIMPPVHPGFDLAREEPPPREPVGAGSDESTFIRPRMGTTVEHPRPMPIAEI